MAGGLTGALAVRWQRAVGGVAISAPRLFSGVWVCLRKPQIPLTRAMARSTRRGARGQPPPSSVVPSQQDKAAQEMVSYGEPEVFAEADVGASQKDLPSTIPAAPSAFEWWWISPPCRSAVLVPEGWTALQGEGQMLYSPMQKYVVTPSKQYDALGMGLWVSQTRGILGRGLFASEAPVTVAEWVLASLVRRTVGWRAQAALNAGVDPSTAMALTASTSASKARAQQVLEAASSLAGDDLGTKEEVAAALATSANLQQDGGDITPETLAALASGHAQSVAEQRGAPEWHKHVMQADDGDSVRPDVVHSWQFAPFLGMDTFGVEFVTPSAHAGADPNASGRRYHAHVVVDGEANMVTEIVFACPEGLWEQAWQTHGQAMVEDMYLNWADDSPFKMQ